MVAAPIERTSGSSAGGRSDPVGSGGGGGFGRANIRRRASLLRHRLPMRSSPYVGWFRHAPPASAPASRTAAADRPRSYSLETASHAATRRSGGYANLMPPGTALAPSSLGMKSSPYIGWFRHAPPSRVRIDKMRPQQSCSTTLEALGRLSDAMTSKTSCPKDAGAGRCSPAGEEVEALLKSLRIRRAHYVDGRLRGGCPLHEEDGGPSDAAETGDGDRDGGTGPSFPPPTAHFDRRIFDSLHQSASTRGLHFNDDASSARSSDDLGASSASVGGAMPGSPSATLGVLNRLAHWFLFPLAHDAYGDVAQSCDAADALYERVGSSVRTALFPLFSSVLRRILLIEDGGAFDDGDLKASRRFRDEDSCHSSGDASEADDRQDKSSADEEVSSARTDGADEAARLLDVSVSSLAEAYYAHQASKEFLEAEADTAGRPPSATVVELSSLRDVPYGRHQLDYVITQIDIARMVRNASRHLDVESILSLPTVTYRARNKTGGEPTEARVEAGDGSGEVPANLQGGADACGTKRETEKEDEVGWSWMIVPPDPEGGGSDLADSQAAGEGAEARGTDKDHEEGGPTCAPPGNLEDRQNPGGPFPGSGHRHRRRYDDDDEIEHCVICLDHFADGDRLRVLPCSHLFHVGCIDRWLSGTASDEECFTAGCPTCKEHPVVGAARCREEEELGGSATTTAAAGNDGVSAAAAAAGSSSDGSVPSWAFARLGDAMARKEGLLTSPSSSSSAAP